MNDGHPVTIRPASLKEAPVMAKMMGEGLDSRLSDLGPWFVKFLHRHMVASKYCACLVAQAENGIVGYAATLLSTKSFYREFFLQKGIVAGFLILPWLFTPKNIRTVLNAIRYSSQAGQDDPEAELASIVVLPEARGMGVGQKLYRRTIDELMNAGIAQLKISTPSDNKIANAMYLKQGCKYIRSEPFCHNVEVNVYFCQILQPPHQSAS